MAGIEEAEKKVSFRNYAPSASHLAPHRGGLPPRARHPQSTLETYKTLNQHISRDQFITLIHPLLSAAIFLPFTFYQLFLRLFQISLPRSPFHGPATGTTPICDGTIGLEILFYQETIRARQKFPWGDYCPAPLSSSWKSTSLYVIFCINIPLLFYSKSTRIFLQLPL